MDEMHLNKVFNLTSSYLGAGSIAFFKRNWPVDYFLGMG